MHHTSTHLLAFILSLVLTAKGSSSVTENARNVAAASNDFGIALFNQLFSASSNDFISPFSISTALSMLYAGARKTTQSDMSKALYFNSHNLAKKNIPMGYKELLSTVTGAQNYTLSIANAAYTQADFTLEPKYVTLLKKNFLATIKSVDFMTQGQQVMQEINDFVNSATKGLIPKLLSEPLSPDTLLVLINAIYFKGNWTTKFNASLTETAPFTSNDGQTNCKLMHQTGKFQYTYSAVLKSQVLSLPYSGNDLSMIIILPSATDGISDLVSVLSSKSVTDAISSMTQKTVDVYLPKFTVETNYLLRSILQGSGFQSAFSDAADFTGVSSEQGIKISEVIHKAKIIVDEKGTEAAAVTAVITVGTTSVGSEIETVLFKADHPFVYLLYHKPTGLVLFMGSLVKPN